MYLLLYEHSRYISFYIRIGEKANMQRSIKFSYLQFACIFVTWEVKGLYHIKWTLEAEINAAFVSYEFSCYFEIKRSNEGERAKNRNRVLLLTKKIIPWNAKTWLNLVNFYGDMLWKIPHVIIFLIYYYLKRMEFILFFLIDWKLSASNYFICANTN